MSAPAQNPPFFGRAWNISIVSPDATYVVSSTVAKGESPLRVIFTIEKRMLLAYWQAEVTILNMSPKTATSVSSSAPNFWARNRYLKLGDPVTISAGYKTGPSGQPFDSESNFLYTGNLLQPIWSRDNVVDFRLTLRLVTGILEDQYNLVNCALAGPISDYDTILAICKKASRPLPILKTSIDDSAKNILSQSKYPGNRVFNGRPFGYIDEIVRKNNLYAWYDPLGLNIRGTNPFERQSSDPNTPDYSFAPPGSNSSGTGTFQGVVKRTLIGSPEIMQNAVRFKVLLDSQVKIGDIVQLTGVIITPLPFQYMKELQPITARNGIYCVVAVKHVGDSRGQGDDWYTEVTAVNQSYFSSVLVARSATGSN